MDVSNETERKAATQFETSPEIVRSFFQSQKKLEKVTNLPLFCKPEVFNIRSMCLEPSIQCVQFHLVVISCSDFYLILSLML